MRYAILKFGFWFLLFGTAHAQDNCFSDRGNCFASPPCGSEGYWAYEKSMRILASENRNELPLTCLETDLVFHKEGLIEQPANDQGTSDAALNKENCVARLGQGNKIYWAITQSNTAIKAPLRISSDGIVRDYSARFVEDADPGNSCLMILSTDVPDLPQGRYYILLRWTANDG